MISLCTVVSNRLWQLKRTLEHNLKFTSSGWVEICIAVYNDEDGTAEYLDKHYAEYIRNNRLRYVEFRDQYKPIDGSSFACGHAKKYSHSIANGKILFNLDADNFMDEETLRKLKGLRSNEILILDPRTMSSDGRAGRVGLHKSLYHDLGGYVDKGRSDDIDLVFRATMMGCRTVYHICAIPPISNEE